MGNSRKSRQRRGGQASEGMEQSHFSFPTKNSETERPYSKGWPPELLGPCFPVENGSIAANGPYPSLNRVANPA